PRRSSRGNSARRIAPVSGGRSGISVKPRRSASRTTTQEPLLEKPSVGGKRAAQEKKLLQKNAQEKALFGSASAAPCRMVLKKKGRSPCGSGPSLGRKRPRRATVTREHLSLPHCNNIHRVAQNASTVDPIVPHFPQNLLHFVQSRSTVRQSGFRHPSEFTINFRNIRRLIHSPAGDFALRKIQA